MKNRKIISFAFIPNKTEDVGWIWLNFYLKHQEYREKWVLVPEMIPFKAWRWITYKKTLCI